MAKPSSAPTVAIKTEIQDITPEAAEDMLGRNTHNRSIRQSQVDHLAGVIQRGEWMLNGDAIRFSESGVLLDGQHRLQAIIQAGATVPSVVISGLPDEGTQDTMDTGAKRNLGDALKLRGESAATKLAATLNYFYRWQVAEQVRSPSVRPTIAQALNILDVHPGLRDSVSEVEKTQRRFHVSSGMLASTHYVFSSIDSDDAAAFFHRLTYGEALEAGSPILVLRQYLEAQSAAGVGARASALHHHALIIKAWNAWRENLHVDRLSWKSGGMRAEAFPEPH